MTDKGILTWGVLLWNLHYYQGKIGKMQTEKPLLPIDPFIPGILSAVQKHSTVIVKASPGSGKTTRLPWELAKNLDKKVVVLEPRRLAAKLAAQRIASENKLTLGKEVGYQFRFEKMTSSETRLTFYTEGTFLKKFLHDPLLNDVDIVLLDEFHERHLETDLALALLRDLQNKRNLKIILMSATLDTKLFEAFTDATSIEIDAKMFPVEVSYLPNQPSVLNRPLELKVKDAVEKVPDENVLVFLPGMREMLKAQSVLTGNVHLLHADLSKEEQEEALSPGKTRKIILATNIAESSVTIPGITVVIDSGIQREAHYSPWNGLKFIEDTPVTKSSAIQRAGRAGRTAPGKCFRLYSEQDFKERPEYTIPEIERADLTDVFLLVTGTALRPLWFHSPPEEKWKKAKLLLENLNAIEGTSLTATGKKMLEFPLDARLSRILIEGEKLEYKLKEKLLHYICDTIENDRTGTLKKRLNFYLKNSGSDKTPWEQCILTGFVDQVARFRSKQRDFIHYSGKTIKAHPSLQDLSDDYYIILDITQRQEAISILPIDESWLWDLSPFPFTEEDEVQMNEKVLLRRKTKLGSIVIEESALKADWTTLNQDLKNKITTLSETKLKQKKQLWRETPEFGRIFYWAKKQNLDLEKVLEELTPSLFYETQTDLNWEDFETFIHQFVLAKISLPNLDAELPVKINLGGKRELTVHYPEGMEPYLEAPIQDFYGLKSTPTIMNGKVPLTLKLLGPHKRPIQVTKDLKNFWEKTYQEMKKEYQRDYPRHNWPENPAEAKPILLKSQLRPTS
jgi:ATP-dependent helicase HrpB